MQFGVRLTNNTGVTLQSVTITYDGEQWRTQNNSAQQLSFSYIIGESPTLASVGYSAVSALNFVSPITVATGSALDGNASANRVAGITSTINVTWAPGEELFLRWTDANDSSNDHGLGIDNLTVVAAVPEASAFVFGGMICMVAGLWSVRQNRLRMEARS
jgi:hypothetical protein